MYVVAGKEHPGARIEGKKLGNVYVVSKEHMEEFLDRAYGLGNDEYVDVEELCDLLDRFIGGRPYVDDE